MLGQIARYIAAMSEIQQPVVQRFLKARQRQGLKPKTLHSDIVALYQFSRDHTGSWDEVTQEQVFTWLEHQQYIRTAKQLYRTKLRVFFQWLGHPIDIPSLRGAKKPPLDPKSLLSPSDVRALIAKLDHPRDRALIATLWDSAARAHELLAVHASDIEFFTTHARLYLLGDVEYTAQGKPVRIPGKTGQRTVPILECVPYLQAWLEYSGIEGLQPVWVSIRKQRLSYDRLLSILKHVSHEVLGRHVHPHLIRKSRLSYLAEQPGWTPAMLCEFAGWKQGSSVQEVYIRLGVRGLEQAMLAMHGKKEDVAPKPSPMKPKRCFRCQHENPANARYCTQCSFVLDPNEARRIMNREQDLIEFMDWLVNNPEKVRELRDEMRKKQK